MESIKEFIEFWNKEKILYAFEKALLKNGIKRSQVESILQSIVND